MAFSRVMFFSPHHSSSDEPTPTLSLFPFVLRSHLAEPEHEAEVERKEEEEEKKTFFSVEITLSLCNLSSFLSFFP